MSGKLFFALSAALEQNENLAQLIQAVPESWKWCDGCLSSPAPKREPQIDASIGYIVQRFHTIRPTIEISGWKKLDAAGKERMQAAFSRLITHKRLPDFVVFDEAGYDPEVVDLGVVKQIIAEYIRYGYRGSLHFYSGHYRDDKYPNPEKATFYLRPVHTVRSMHTEYPEILEPCIELAWNDAECRGKRENLEIIINACEKLGLPRFHPIPARLPP